MAIHSTYLAVLFHPAKFRKALDYAERELAGIEFDGIAVTGNSGTIFGGALAARMDKGLFLIRKPGTDCHSSYKVEGDDMRRTYIFVDDLVCSGATFERVWKAMEEKFPGTKYVGRYTYSTGCYTPSVLSGPRPLSSSERSVLEELTDWMT